MIKSNERRTLQKPHENSCFEKREHGSELGIEFEKKDGTKRFALNSFLSAVDFDGSGELVFRYTFGTITVKGKALQPLWGLIRTGTLMRLSESGTPPVNSLFISEITLADSSTASTLEPLFPE